MTPPTGSNRSASAFASITTAVILAGAVLYFMRPVILPIVLALFLAILARPLQARLQRFLPASLALLTTVLVVGATLLALPLLFTASLQVVGQRLPTYGPRLASLAAELETFVQHAGIDPKAFDLSSDNALASILGIVTNSLQGLANFIGTALLVVFLLTFILAEANMLRAKLLVALRPTNHAAVMASFASMQDRIQRYVTTKTLFSALNAIGAGLITAFIGIDFPLLWTLLTFILYYIPTFGAFVAVIPPVILALVQFDTPTPALITAGSLAVLFNVLGNVIEPRMLGRSLALSPLVVFVSLMFWGWFFGVIGVILSVPLTVGIAILCQHIAPLKPVAVLLSDKPRPPSPG